MKTYETLKQKREASLGAFITNAILSLFTHAPLITKVYNITETLIEQLKSERSPRRLHNYK